MIQRWLIALSVLACVESQAADFVLMKNGDRITGEIKKIWNDEVFIEPEYGDEYAVEMEHVAYVHTDEPFEVAFREGRRIFKVMGRLGLDDEGQPSVMTDDGTRYPLARVDNVQEVEEFFDWEVRSDISVNVATGNTKTNNGRFYAYGRMKLGEHRHQLQFTRDGAAADGETTKNQTQVGYEDQWTFKDDWFLRGAVGWKRDPIKELEGRTQLFLGPGYHFWDDSKRTLSLSMGPTYLIENYTGESQQESVSIAAALSYEQRFLKDDLVLFHETNYQSVVTGRKNEILNTKTGLRWDLPRDVYVNLQVDYDYESNPAEGSVGTDVTYLVGVGVELD